MSKTFKRGQHVSIPKGVAAWSTHPQRSRFVTGKKYRVRVHATLPPVHICVGYRNYDVDGNVNHESLHYSDRHDPPRIKELYGTDELEALREHFVELGKSHRDDGTSWAHIFIEMQPAQVMWAGTGGYWCYVPTTAICQEEA